MRGGAFAGRKHAALVHQNGDGGDFEQRMAMAIEAAGFHVHNDGQETAKTVGYAA